MKWKITDTLTGALERLERSMDEWKTPLKEFGENEILPWIEELTPEEEEYLVASARENMKVQTTLTGFNLSFKMTGDKNPNRHKDFITESGHYLDYALFQHENELHHPKPGATDHYLERPIRDSIDFYPYDMGELLLKKLESVRK